MTDQEVFELGLDLRRTLLNDFKKFWEANKKLDTKQIFFINSTVMSSLIAQIVFLLFKKDVGTKHQCRYIDQMCELSKKMLIDGKHLIDEGINFQ